ncbi:MAG: TetR/AcrR family transcriptional regulator [Methylocystis sp.]|uniref:TetR/AcrR family transcriptional regulator n=1 Tax=Methylocystis sp. TaxID=1911079 RepID=UPI003DA6774E
MVNAMSRRLDKLDAERQKRLFESAAEEFAAHGFDGASLNRILEKSGMSKSSLYYYFDDKADLFTTMIERSLTVLFKEIGGFDPTALEAKTFWDAFEELYRRAIAVVDRNAWLVQFGGMFYRLRSDPRQGSATGRLFRAVREWVTLIIARGQALGVVRTDLPQSLLIDSTMSLLESLDRWVVAHWSQLESAEKDVMPQKHIALFRSLISAQSTGDAR